MENKYISFGPCFCGLCNVIMSYEIAFAISYITKRKIILPPKTWISHIEKFVDIWEIFDKDVVTSEFDCVEFEDVPEIRDNIDLIKGDKSYTQNIGKFVEEFYDVKLLNEKNDPDLLYNCDIVFSDQHYSTQDFRNFLGCIKKRKVMYLNFPNKFIHFEGNLLGSFWYHVYPGNSIERDKLKRKINKSFRYKKKYYDMSENVTKKIGEYNALHIRRGDFLYARSSDYLNSVDSGEKILEKILPIISNDIPLYIATDETNLDFFEPIKKSYKVYFYRDFGYNLNNLESAALEQVICSNAEYFYGSWFSTYTKRINVMRGCDGKRVADWMAYNYIPPPSAIPKLDTAFPWNFVEDCRWHWNYSWHPQWTFEEK
jgi:hypothetical protein